MHSFLSHVFIKNEFNLLQDVEVNKLLFVDGKMDKKGSNLHIYFWAIVPVEEVDLQLNLIILYFIFQRQYYVQKTVLKPF